MSVQTGLPHSTTASPARTAGRPAGKTLVALLFGAPSLVMIVAGAVTLVPPDGGRLEAQAKQARQRVTDIVNRPVAPLPRTAMAREFSSGWFEPGAVKPDFATVDVRTTQELPYLRYRYVTTSANPSAMFPGKDIESNAMTKYFYLDRTLPKRRLSEREMLEINSLYRVIGRAEHASATRTETAGALFGSAFFVMLAMTFQLRRRRPAAAPYP